jgi:hypothetical protein|tara:strand:+ start:1558 stop:1854 length:297 start_codon:yes stop_codon:yes gene_type:complete
MKELSEDSKFQISLKTLGGIAMLIFAFAGMWVSLQASISEAKELPVLPMSPQEITLKDELIRKTIMNLEKQQETQKEQLDKIETKIDKIDERLYNLNK